jgi:hypothetical protein
VGQAGLLVEFCDGGLGIRPQLGGGGAKGIGRLQGMAPLDPAAPAYVDVELAVDGPAGDLDLELLGDVAFVERAAAVGTDLGQRCLVDLVNLFGRGWLAVGFGAVVLARLPTGFLGLGRGLALGEWGGLALAGAGRLVELAAEALVLGLQVVDPPLKGLAVGTPDRFHVGIIRSTGTCSCADARRGMVQLELAALIKPKRERP